MTEIEIIKEVLPFVPPTIVPQEKVETEPETFGVNVEVMTVIKPVEPRGVSSVYEEDDVEEKVINDEVREVAYGLPAFTEYLKEQRGDALNYGDW